MLCARQKRKRKSKYIKEKEKITLSLIDTFNKAGNLALDLRSRGLKKEIKSEEYEQNRKWNREQEELLTKIEQARKMKLPIHGSQNGTSRIQNLNRSGYYDQCY